MTEQLDFETALERRLRARAAAASRPFDAVAVAGAAIARSPARRGFFHVRAMPWTSPMTRVWLLLALLLALLAGTLLAGALLQHRAPWLAVARPDGIYLAHTDGSLVRRLTDTGTYTRLSWSADGALLLVNDVFQDGEVSRMTVFRLDGSVAWTTDKSFGDAAWSHRGHRVAWYELHTVVVTDVDSGESTRLAGTRYNSWVGSLDWSPDDTRIVAVGSVADPLHAQLDADSGRLLVVPLDGGDPVVLTPDTFYLQYQAWSPDGRSIAAYCSEDCPEQFSIAIFDATTGERIDGTAAGGFPVVWSPDGTRLAWMRSDDGKVMVDTLPLSDGGAVAVLPEPGAQHVEGWTPDGALLVTTGSSDPASPDLWRVEADGSHPVLLAHGVTAAALQPTP